MRASYGNINTETKHFFMTLLKKTTYGGKMPASREKTVQDWNQNRQSQGTIYMFSTTGLSKS